MEAARTIRDSVQQVAHLRAQASADPDLAQALHAVKRMQSCRFSGLYADLLRGGTFAEGARFFLEELYGEHDFSRRDDQFARIASAIEKLFPQRVAQAAADLAALHALTEDLDLSMARAWAMSCTPVGPARYVGAWKTVGRPDDRRLQLRCVLALGRELAGLTKTPGLRTMLRMMRGAAGAAGLGDLQRFLESGFDTFAGMARRSGAVDAFLGTVDERESALIDLLFIAEPVVGETELVRILGQAP